MSLEADLRTALLADAGVQAQIAQRLYLMQKPPRCSFPCAAYQRISTQRLYTQALGGSQATRGWCRFQVTIWGDTATGGAQVLTVRDAILAALQTFNLGALPASPSVLSQAPNFILQERMGLEPQPEQPLVKYMMDVQVWFGPGQ